MSNESSAGDVFRFIQLRPQLPVSEAGALPLVGSTPLAKRLGGLGTPAARAAEANTFLASNKIESSEDAPLGEAVESAVGMFASDEGDEAVLQQLIDAVPALADVSDAAMAAVSDVLLAAYHATERVPADLNRLATLYRVYRAPEADEGTRQSSLRTYLHRPLLAPAVTSQPTATPRRAVAANKNHTAARAALDNAIAELARLHRPELLNRPASRGGRAADVPFALSSAGQKEVSAKTTAVLAANSIDLLRMPLALAVNALSAAKLRMPLPAIEWPFPPIVTAGGVTLPPMPGPAFVKPAGVADLLVVKQQIKRYEAAEIAHVENVLIGETKSRAVRQLDRTEETFLTETETTRTRESEVQTTDRFELNRETSRTIKEDQKIGLGLSLSGKYGPTVEFSSKFSLDASTAKDESVKSSSRFAKDVVNRSLERITERIHEVRTQTIIHEVEETNLHELKNQTQQHVVGIYQFLDKVYETQVFNYGIREMFDFMVPEPASFLWYVATHPTLDVKLPPVPKPISAVCPDASYLTEDLAVQLAAEYGADIEPAPVPFIVVPFSTKHGGEEAGEGGEPRSVFQADLAVPAGYRPLWSEVNVIAVTDDNPVVLVAVGGEQVVWKPGSSDRIPVSSGNELANQPVEFLSFTNAPYEVGKDTKLQVSVVAYETNTYSVNLATVAMRTDDYLHRWQITTFGKLRGAYEDRQREYDQKVEQLTAAAQAKAERENQLPFGAPPAANLQVIKAELKKHCIALVTQQWYDAFDATKDGQPPTFDFAEAAAEGAYIRFFEQAFEWEQLQFVFYPYFWARKSTWVDRFVRQDLDPQFLEFLRAGSARVVVPVRPGFETAITHFLETGKIWAGEDAPPPINSPLYVSIIDEIKERTAAPQNEIAVGDPWDTRVPTALVLVRSKGDLPVWKRSAPGEWTWTPDQA